MIGLIIIGNNVLTEVEQGLLWEPVDVIPSPTPSRSGTGGGGISFCRRRGTPGRHRSARAGTLRNSRCRPEPGCDPSPGSFRRQSLECRRTWALVPVAVAQLALRLQLAALVLVHDFFVAFFPHSAIFKTVCNIV